ncbi:hypothetical protein A1A1_14294 [Planococcus antarcticus DSM 14505]|uniref:Uncharacterized protein n=1 Tax=Planococcus antarcticus DSM 14505 TaxID=1185653 RepID=A0AA87IJF4_9BACL|nr:hypothetical protein [Planococcus antarcticus]EIM05815.1 hypothetical protein A1A1_14294 [Planococcus antarcticus DSM 14505]
MDKNKVILEVLEDMDKRIDAGIKATTPQDREDLKQDITTRLVKAAADMEPISFWQFKEKLDDKK